MSDNGAPSHNDSDLAAELAANGISQNVLTEYKASIRSRRRGQHTAATSTRALQAAPYPLSRPAPSTSQSRGKGKKKKSGQVFAPLPSELAFPETFDDGTPQPTPQQSFQQTPPPIPQQLNQLSATSQPIPLFQPTPTPTPQPTPTPPLLFQPTSTPQEQVDGPQDVAADNSTEEVEVNNTLNDDQDEDMSDSQAVETQLGMASAEEELPDANRPKKGRKRRRTDPDSGTNSDSGTSSVGEETVRLAGRGRNNPEIADGVLDEAAETQLEEADMADNELDEAIEDLSEIRKRNIARLQKRQSGEGLTKDDAIRMYKYFGRLEHKLDALFAGVASHRNEPAAVPRHGGKRLKLEAPKQIVPNYHADNELELMKQVRHLTKYLMKRENRKSPFPEPPTREELDTYASRKIGGPTPANFRLDLAAYSYQSAWNLAAAKLFADSYIGQRGRDTANREVIKDLFLRHLHDLGEQYKDLKVLQLSPDDDLRIKLDARNARRLTTRRASLGLRRYNVVEGERKLKRIASLLLKLGRDGMSDDEFAPGPFSPPKYNIVRLAWRSKALTALLRNLDALHIYTRFSNGHKPSRGNWPRRRERSSLVDNTRAPPKGLPENCYDKAWYSRLTPIEKKQLNATQPIEFELPTKLQRRADRYRAVKTPDQVPAHMSDDDDSDKEDSSSDDAYQK